LKPEDANVRFNYGTALFNAGKFQDAASNYREAVRLNPSFAHAHYNLGMTLLRLNDPKSAQAEFAEAHRLDPTLNTPVAAK
jgi:Flp pilus assembly protein TadD